MSMKSGELIVLLSDATGMGPMLYQQVHNGMALAGEPVPQGSVGLFLSHTKSFSPAQFVGRRYVCVIVNDRVGYVQDDRVGRLRCKATSERGRI